MPAVSQTVNLLSESSRKPTGRATASQSSDFVFRSNQKRRKTGPSVAYKPNGLGNLLTEKFVSEVESQFDRLVYRHDPRKIIRAISKRTGATEEAVAHILLVGKLTQYRAENREFRRWISEVLPRVAQAGEAAWKQRRTA